MESFDDDDDGKFLEEYHFPIEVDEVRELLRDPYEKKVFREIVRDTHQLTLLKGGYWFINSCEEPIGDWSLEFWLYGETPPVTDIDDIFKELTKLFPCVGNTHNFYDYCPHVPISLVSTKCIISPTLRVEFNEWFSGGKQGLYVCGISSEEKYQERVVRDENKYTVFLKHVKIPQFNITPCIIESNEDNPFIEFYRMRSYSPCSSWSSSEECD